MELEHVKGNTWVLKDWELIPLYKLDDHRCVLLDTGLAEQREALDEALQREGLIPVGVLCSHAHIDHMGNNAFFKEKYGTKIAMSLGEAAHQFSYLAMGVPNYLLSVGDLESSSAHGGTIHLADQIILPHEDKIQFCGAEFEIVHTPGHTSDHICAKTPDDVLYLADAMMTGQTLHRSKFPYAYDMGAYLDSMRDLRSVKAEKFVVAHYGIYDEILPLIDMEARFLRERMLDLLDLVEDYTTPKLMASAICRAYRINAHSVRDLGYFEAASLSYINYLRELEMLEAYIEDNMILYRLTEQAKTRRSRESDLPPTGLFR